MAIQNDNTSVLETSQDLEAPPEVSTTGNSDSAKVSQATMHSLKLHLSSDLHPLTE
jgi:hypothetical protein